MGVRNWHDRLRGGEIRAHEALPPHYPTCFGCGPQCEAGLHVLAHLEGSEVVTTHVFARHHSGAPGIVHGGLVSALVDDVLGYLLYVIREPGVTRRLEVDYVKPVLIGVAYDVRARIDRRDGRKVFVSCEGTGPDGVRAFAATGLFIVVPLEHFDQGTGGSGGDPVAL